MNVVIWQKSISTSPSCGSISIVENAGSIWSPFWLLSDGWHIWHSVSVFGSSLRTKLASGRLCMLGILDILFLEIFNILKRYYGLCVWCFPTLQSIDFLKTVDNRVWTPKMLKFSIKKVYLEGTYFKISGATLLTIDSKKKSMAYISTFVIISCSFA